MYAGNTDYADDVELVAEVFRMLSEPTRVAILVSLSAKGELAVGDLATATRKRPSTVSQHLAKLRMAGLVTTRRQGTTVFYAAANEHVVQLVADALRHAEHLAPGTPRHHRDVV